MLVQIEHIRHEQKPAFVHLMNLYNYDFTEYEDEDINEDGLYNYENYRRIIKDEYWNDATWHTFFIRVNKKLAGFILVHNQCHFIDDKDAHNIDEFFVMRRYRRMGVGRFAAKYVFDMFRGKWEILQLPSNLHAHKFWEAVISEYTEANYQECGSATEEWIGFTFDNAIS